MAWKQNILIRKWLWVVRNLSYVAFYSIKVPCLLPLKSLLTLFKRKKVRSFLQRSNSDDTQVADSAACHSTGLKWKSTEAVRAAQLTIEAKHIVGEIRGFKQGNKKVTVLYG